MQARLSQEVLYDSLALLIFRVHYTWQPTEEAAGGAGAVSIT